MGSPCGLLTRSSFYCCLPIFVFLPPYGVRLDGGQDAMAHRRRGFVRPVLPHSPVIFSAVPTSETQRVSRGKHRLLSAHDRQIYVVWPYDGYRALSCVADSPRPCPASNLPALYPSGYGAYLYVDPRFCLRVGHSLRSLSPSVSLPLRSAFRRTLLQHPCLQLSFPSVRVDLDFAWHLCHSVRHHHLAAGPSPAHNNGVE